MTRKSIKVCSGGKWWVAIKGEDFVVARIKSGVLKDRIFASFSEKGVG